MSLSNTATPKYYGLFREEVLRGNIPVNKEISMEMNRIDDLIASRIYYYDEDVVEGFVNYCEQGSMHRSSFCRALNCIKCIRWEHLLFPYQV